LGIEEAAVRAAAAHDPLAETARVLVKRGLPVAEIVPLLGMSEAAVHEVAKAAKVGRGSSHTTAAMAGRVLGSALQRRLDDLSTEDAELCCPVSLTLFVDPMIASDGFMYEKESIVVLIKGKHPSPLTREPLESALFPAKQKKSEVMAFREQRSNELMQFSEDASEQQPQMAISALKRVAEYLEVLRPAQVPGLSTRAAGLWAKLGQQVPAMLQPFIAARG
jgi:hypothetical protein